MVGKTGHGKIVKLMDFPFVIKHKKQQNPHGKLHNLPRPPLDHAALSKAMRVTHLLEGSKARAVLAR